MISERKRQQIIAELRADPNAHRVMLKVGDIGYNSVWLIAKAAGIDLIAGRAVRFKPTITPEKRAEVIAALRAKANARQVMLKVGGMSYSTVWQIAKDEGIDLAKRRVLPCPRRGSQRIGAVRRARIIAALQKNPNANLVMREVGGVCYRSVWLIAKAMGIDLSAGRAFKFTPKITAEKRAEVIAALRAKANAGQVARHVGGVSHASVWKIAKIEGIVLNAGKVGRPRRSPAPSIGLAPVFVSAS